MQDIVAELSWRGLVHQTTDPEIGKHLLTGPHTVYCGFDPTADSLHVGNLLGIVSLTRFQKAGHKAIAIAGGGTGFVGDPSGKSAERSLLTAEQLDANCRAIQSIISRIFANAGAGDAQLINNADWLCKISLIEFLRDVGKHFTVNHMMEKESVRARLEDRAHGISFTEFSYMLLQAYDFFYLHEHHGCRVQIGGSDQFGNITAGCELIRRTYFKREGGEEGAHSKRALGLTWPLITRSDGKKFGKTEDGAIWLSAHRTSPYEFYQYWINTPDADTGRFLRNFTGLSREEIDALEAKTKAEPQKREAQKALAQYMTTLVHGKDECEKAEKAASALFSAGSGGGELSLEALEQLAKEAPSGPLAKAKLDGEGASLLDLMAESKLWPSKGEAKRAITGGGAYLNNAKIGDLGKKVTAADLLHGRYLVLRKGKKDYFLYRAE
ncbi:MAG: tyrosine--tRNA ligase [Planctomycetota bacterium]|nr:tyrosine--tRNA ligase [Planctomycetota bacterium]